MGVDKVADMDMVVGKVVNRVARMVANMDFSIIFWAFLGEIFCISQLIFLICSVKCFEFFSEMFCISR